MKIAITVQEKSLDAAIDPRFGRCASAIVVDSGSQEILDGGQNAAAQAPGGAGTQTAQWIVQLGAEAIITGNIGPKAHSVIAAAGVPVYLSPGGTAREALEAFSKGELKEIQAPSVQSHSGMRSQGQS